MPASTKLDKRDLHVKYVTLFVVRKSTSQVGMDVGKK